MIKILILNIHASLNFEFSLIKLLVITVLIEKKKLNCTKSLMKILESLTL